MQLPVLPIIGGILIGLSAVLLMRSIGRIAGISGIVWGALTAQAGERVWRLLFLFGLLLGTIGFHFVSDQAYPAVNDNYVLALAAGLLVGFGVKLGSGCTSGHGVCGMSRLSPRSFVATATFMFTAIVTVAVFKLLIGDGS